MGIAHLRWLYPTTNHVLCPARAGSSQIHIKLFEVQLSESLGFEALSYCWVTEDGDASRNHVMYSEETQVLVTADCKAVLRRLRQEEPHKLWIYSICIYLDRQRTKY